MTGRQQIRELLSSQKQSVDMNRFPDLFVLGPQCTASTWLHKNLDMHPQVFMSHPKELFFFCEDQLVQYLGREEEFDLNSYMRHFEHWRVGNSANRSLFHHWVRPARRPRVIGEATASYAWQPVEVIQGIVDLNPEIRGVLLVRNPVDKVWSNMRRKMTKERGYDSPVEVPDAEIDAFIHDPHQINTALFSTMISNWSQNLKEGHLFVGSFDDVSSRPQQLLLEIFEFVGVASEKQYVTEHAYQKTRVGGRRPLTDRWRKELKNIFNDELASLKEQYGFEWFESD